MRHWLAMGRPSKYTDAIAKEICRRIAEGETLRSICAEPGTPSIDAVCDWLEKRPDFRQQYAQARSLQADRFAERVVDEAFSAKDAQIGRLRMDALKWAASKIAPKKYGERVELEHSGEPQRIVVKIGGKTDVGA